MKKNPQPSEKIQKILANRGIGSRRQIENLLMEGRVKVNGRVASLGDRALASDQFSVNNRPIKLQDPRKTETQVIS